ncbi:hypothetical protein [Streptomyces daliensis]|uniref:Uncharacterized protein n=1 Tax=Streptomyces daliensis TaxID=299421 RepID=A0A8T4IQ06_9ACTN|nr:hypothetical protein [Streptomyces daliensis]
MKRDEQGRKWAQPFHLKLPRQVGAKVGKHLRHGDVARIGDRLFHIDDVLDHEDVTKRLLLGRWDGTEGVDSSIVEAEEFYEVG